MKLLYDPNTGEIIRAVLDQDYLTAHHDGEVFEIDEIEDNRLLIIEILNNVPLQNDQEQGRWYIENGELFERDGWQPESIL